MTERSHRNSFYQLDEDRIREEAMYDGFYAVVTNLEGDVREVININKRRWEIEENFRIMKTEFEARPVFVRQEDSIKAHFLTCYISLLVYRLLEKKLGEEYHLQRNFEDALENEYDPVVQRQWLHSFLQAHETDRCPAHSLRFPNGLRIHLKGRLCGQSSKKQNRKNSTISKIVHIDAKPVKQPHP